MYINPVSWYGTCVMAALFLVFSNGSFNFQLFGQVDQDSLFQSVGGPGTPIAAISALINLPQLLVSITYLGYSSMFTSIMVCQELSHYTHARKGLRVTKPRGLQRSSRWLSVPFRYSIPYATIMALLHWTMSESLFLVRARTYDIYGAPLLANDTNVTPNPIQQTWGWSRPALCISLLIGLLLMIVSLYITKRKFRPGMPLVST